MAKILKVDPETGKLILTDACGPASADEVVICGRAPAGRSPYRIPEDLVEERPSAGAGTAWGSRATAYDQHDRAANSNSPVGSAGQTGWRTELLRDWAAEREARAKEREP